MRKYRITPLIEYDDSDGGLTQEELFNKLIREYGPRVDFQLGLVSDIDFSSDALSLYNDFIAKWVLHNDKNQTIQANNSSDD